MVVDGIATFEDQKKEKKEMYFRIYPKYCVDYQRIINSTFGPIKITKKNHLPIHLMIYDVKSHTEHVITSPFTCYDWERSNLYIGKPLRKIFSVSHLQLRDFYEARRFSSGGLPRGMRPCSSIGRSSPGHLLSGVPLRGGGFGRRERAKSRSLPGSARRTSSRSGAAGTWARGEARAGT